MNWTTDKPTEAGWTSTKPTEAGWYWFRDLSRPYEDEREPYVVKVRQYAQHLAVGNCRLEGAPYGRGEWLGPITPTDRQQGKVEGLREAGQIIAKVCEWYEGGTLENILEEFYKQIEQAAQDEKEVEE